MIRRVRKNREYAIRKGYYMFTHNDKETCERKVLTHLLESLIQTSDELTELLRKIETDNEYKKLDFYYHCSW